jgi:hypothetical protein
MPEAWDLPKECSDTHFAPTGEENEIIRLNVLLNVHHNTSIQWNQRDELLIQFIED